LSFDFGGLNYLFVGGGSKGCHIGRGLIGFMPSPSLFDALAKKFLLHNFLSYKR
jgi:hypothetical protein